MKEENKKKDVKLIPGRKAPYPGESGFDTTYKSIKIVQVAKKVGEGDEDFTIVKKVITTETPIKDVVEADRDNCGVESVLRMFARTQDPSILPVDTGNCHVDLVGAPETLMEVKAMGVNAEAAFKTLPDELVNGMDMTSFINSMSQEKFDEFIKAVQGRAAGKVENKDGE